MKKQIGLWVKGYGSRCLTLIAYPLTLYLFCGYAMAYAVDDCKACHQLEADTFVKTAHALDNDCGVCHGDAGKHLKDENKKENIINPANIGLKKANSLCLTCHGEKDKDVREKFIALPNLHDDLRCYECHKAHLKVSDEPDGLEEFRSDLSIDCADCHSREADSFFSSGHGLAGMKCADCHKLHEIKTISQDIEGQIDRCLSCHPAQELEFKAAYAHPLRQRQIKCTDCHNPHDSNYEKMLKDEGDDLCRACHADIVIEGGKHPVSKNTNHPFKTVKCLDCHRPHGSNFDKLLKHNIDNICKTCHN